MSESEPHRHLLFTPGPLNTSDRVKRAMLRDYGSREPAFIDLVREIRGNLLAIAGVSVEAGFEAVPIQGSGTFGLESVIGSVVPRNGKLLVLENGAYGKRMIQIAECLEIPVTSLSCDETEVPDLKRIDEVLDGDPAITHVAAVHCETTTGILNPIAGIGEIVERHRRSFVVDAMSSFGGLPIDLSRTKIDFLISSANKCLEGVPGFSFALARREDLEGARGNSRSVSLDLVAQWDGLEDNGQFRFTPPTHVLLAFRQALVELREEGGVPARYRRYRKNSETLIDGMEELGFRCLLDDSVRSPIITSFIEPDHPAFSFESFYARLAARQFIIYPGKLGRKASFRIGSIGRISPGDIIRLLEAIRVTLKEMRVELRRGVAAG